MCTPRDLHPWSLTVYSQPRTLARTPLVAMASDTAADSTPHRTHSSAPSLANSVRVSKLSRAVLRPHLSLRHPHCRPRQHAPCLRPVSCHGRSAPSVAAAPSLPPARPAYGRSKHASPGIASWPRLSPSSHPRDSKARPAPAPDPGHAAAVPARTRRSRMSPRH